MATTKKKAPAKKAAAKKKAAAPVELALPEIKLPKGVKVGSVLMLTVDKALMTKHHPKLAGNFDYGDYPGLVTKVVDHKVSVTLAYPDEEGATEDTILDLKTSSFPDKAMVSKVVLLATKAAEKILDKYFSPETEPTEGEQESIEYI